MFLRKVDRDFSDDVLKEIMNTDFQQKYEVLHNQAKKKDKYIKYIKYVFIAFFILFVSLFTFTIMFTENIMY
jgi:hypothetical protein